VKRLSSFAYRARFETRFSRPAYILSRRLSTERLICEIRDARFTILFRGVPFRPLNRHTWSFISLGWQFALLRSDAHRSRLRNCRFSRACIAHRVDLLPPRPCRRSLARTCHFRFPDSVLPVSGHPVPLFARTRSISRYKNYSPLSSSSSSSFFLFFFFFSFSSFFYLIMCSHSCLFSIYAVRYALRLAARSLNLKCISRLLPPLLPPSLSSFLSPSLPSFLLSSLLPFHPHLDFS